MIRNLAQCPYCSKCEIALDDSPALAFNPGGIAQPCQHLAWVDGRYSQWEPSPQGIDHVIGSTEFRWDPPEDGAAERTEGLLPYLKELVNQGPTWAMAPSVPFTLCMLVAEENHTDKAGVLHARWDVDGWALFATDVAAFWKALPECQERQMEGLRVEDLNSDV